MVNNKIAWGKDRDFLLILANKWIEFFFYYLGL